MTNQKGERNSEQLNTALGKEVSGNLKTKHS